VTEPIQGNGSAAAGRPLGTLIASVVNGAGELLRKHVELARIEAAEAVAERAKGTGMMAAAGVFGVFALAFVAAAGSSALDIILPTWAAQLIVAGVFVLGAGVLVAVGRSSIRNAPNTERTQQQLKEDARWAKQQIAR
jgi:hypothetical protein